MPDALLIAAHGSRDEAGVAEFWALFDAWQALRPDRLQAAGFLEFARPTIGEAVDELVARGADRIVVAPAMLMAAGHVKNDVPSELAEARGRHPGVSITMARALDIHPALLELCDRRHREAIAGRPEILADRTVLLVVGRGTSDPDANANIARVARFLWESSGVGFATIGFSGLAKPGVDEALDLCRRLGFSRVVVQPYFLFDGVLLKRIYEAADRLAAAEPGLDVVPVGHLRLDPLLVRAFEDRAFEAIHGEPHMNCDVCKYRVRLIGREADWGAPQEGNHHHARAGHDDHAPSPRRRRIFAPAAVEEPSTHPWDDRLLRRLELAR